MSTLDTLKTIGFGYGFLGNNKTFKCRYKTALADQIMDIIAPAHRRLVIKYETGGGYTFLAVIQHKTSIIWPVLERAVKKAKMYELATQN